MSESKLQAEDEYLRSRPVVTVTAVDTSPNPAPLTDELNLEVDFELDKPVKNGVWDIELGRVEVTDYDKGENHFQFSVSQINIAGIQPSQFTNCGLLIAAFKDDEGDILDLKMVIQVSEQRNGLQRIIYNPLE